MKEETRQNQDGTVAESNVKSTKEVILSTALRLFSQNGYEGVSVRDISREIGITQAALYKHYKSKRDIFDSIVRRMFDEDFNHAQEYEMPEDTFSKLPDRYKNTQLERIKDFAAAQFRYWTEDGFASDFRRMITVEQYKSPEMSELYHNHMSGGVVGYLEDLFRESGIGNAKSCRQLAIEFYSPIYLLMNMYDTALDKQEITKTAMAHIENFFKK